MFTYKMWVMTKRALAMAITICCAYLALEGWGTQAGVAWLFAFIAWVNLAFDKHE